MHDQLQSGASKVRLERGKEHGIVDRLVREEFGTDFIITSSIDWSSACLGAYETWRQHVSKAVWQARWIHPCAVCSIQMRRRQPTRNHPTQLHAGDFLVLDAHVLNRSQPASLGLRHDVPESKSPSPATLPRRPALRPEYFAWSR
eukprot:2914706-Rhodomonas_salina.1